MDYRQQRISHHAEVSYPLLERGYLSIGFSDFWNQAFIHRIRSEGWDTFEEEVEEVWGKHPRKQYTLWRFVVEMQVGDWAIVPSWGVFSIYEITADVSPIGQLDVTELSTWNGDAVTMNGDYLIVGAHSVDFGFVRNVKPIATNIQRYDFADADLSSLMKIWNTNANIIDLSESLSKALEAFRPNVPINLYSLILRAPRNHVLKLIQSDLVPDKLEQLIKWYFEQLKTIYYVQAKRYKNETSGCATEQIKAYVDHKDKMYEGYTKVAWGSLQVTAFRRRQSSLYRKTSYNSSTVKTLPA